MNELLDLLAAGGDIGIWVLVILLYKWERRLTIMEVKHSSHLEVHHGQKS